jgi:fructose transport system substrate-binding protein
VIALDTPLEPIDAADATFATDNFLAGELIGKWAAATLGDEAANARIAMLDLAVSQPRRRAARPGLPDRLRHRHQGSEPLGRRGRSAHRRQRRDRRQRGRRPTAMENLLAKDPMINVVYTINEPAAAGAYEALKAIGRENDVLIVSVDGGCPGVQNIADGVIGATSQQYPLLMASLGIEAIKAWAKDGTKPADHARQGLLRHRRGPRHRQAGRRGRVDLGRGRHGQVLGLITRPRSDTDGAALGPPHCKGTPALCDP